jgi:hypothetical protein
MKDLSSIIRNNKKKCENFVKSNKMKSIVLTNDTVSHIMSGTVFFYNMHIA